jgi:hypothetical protein
VIRSAVCAIASISLAALDCACSTASCKTYAASGLRITVTDNANSPVCDAAVTAVDGKFSEVLQPSGGDQCSYFGVFERPGTYTVTAWNGKQMGLASKLKVSKDACHVKTVTATIRTGFAS